MSATTEILPFAGSNTANVIPQADYASMTSLLANGFVAGTAQSAMLNKVWRQSSFIAAGIAAWMANRNVSVLDDGDLPALVSKIEQALNSSLVKNIAGGSNVILDPLTEAVCPIINLTGVLTANVVIYVPATSRSWIIANNTSGAFTVTVSAATGTGVVIKQTDAETVYFDGVNVRSVAPTPTVGVTAAAAENSTKLATTAWLYIAMQYIAAAAGATLVTGAAGYIRLPTWLGGWIVQWVNISAANGAFTGTYSYPVAFPTQCSGVIIGNSSYATGSVSGYVHRARSLNLSQFYVQEDNFSGAGVGNTATAFVIAFGQ